MKKVILMFVVALSVATASAQINVGLYGGAKISKDSKFDIDNMGFGGGISAEYLIIPNLGVGINAGYYIMESEKYGDMSMTSYLLPVNLSGKFYFLTNSFRPYGGVEGGLYTVGFSGKYAGQSMSESSSKFGVGPVVGFQLGFSNNLALDINAKYSHIFLDGESTGFISANLGLVFRLGR